MNKSPAHIQRSSAAIQRQEPFFAPRPAVSNNRAVEETESLQEVGGGQMSGSLLSPRKDQVQIGTSPRENDPQNMIQRTGVIDQSTPTNHSPNLVYPWGPPSPSGYEYYTHTDAGSPLEVWVALGGPEAERYWCHGHSLGTYSRWLYSVYSGPPLQQVLTDEYNAIPEARVQSGDIAVWEPSYGHSAKVETPVLSGSNIDAALTMMSSKNGRAPLANMTLAAVKKAYAGLRSLVRFYRRR